MSCNLGKFEISNKLDSLAKATKGDKSVDVYVFGLWTSIHVVFAACFFCRRR